MCNTYEIKNLKELLGSNLEASEKIEKYDVSGLTAPGENYGSIMLRVIIEIKNKKNGERRTISAVGKSFPHSERIQEIFNTQVTFRNELKFYTLIVPTFQNFLKKKDVTGDVDYVAKFLGGRLNLDQNTQRVDKNAILMMENLKDLGYTTGKKTEGLDLPTSKLVLEQLAKLHAVGMALKLQDPENFNKNLRPYFYTFVVEKEIHKMISGNVIKTLESNGFSEKEIAKVAAAMTADCHKRNISDSWGTLIHYDTWVNNLLIKWKGNQPVHAVIVDFQVFDYGTPLNDVMFYILSSVKTDIFLQSIDPLLKHYFENLLKNLRKLDCDTKELTESEFLNQVKFAAKEYEYAHTMWMLLPMMSEAFKSVDDFNKEDDDATVSWSEEHKRKIVVITRECLRRAWL